jgi:hypothetical protein
MRYHFYIMLLVLSALGCSTTGTTPRDAGSPTPVADPVPDPAQPRPGTGGSEQSQVALRADQAPLVDVRDALEEDSLLGRRVRIAGKCVARGEGRRAGSWTLDQSGATIEVRGLVPTSCSPAEGENLTIFAQIEPQTSGSRERILLRLPS